MLNSFLKTHLDKPFMARVANATGRVTVKGIVETDGRLSDVQILRGLRPDCDQEALRVMRHANFWRPALKGGKPVRQAVTYPVTFQANAPVYYAQGNSMMYYKDDVLSADPATADKVIILPVDTTTGLPTGDLRICKASKGVPGKEVARFPFTRVHSESEDMDSTVMIGHKQPDGDWIGMIYTLRLDGSLLKTESADRNESPTTYYHRNGQVALQEDNMTKRRVAYFSSGLLKRTQQWVIDDPNDKMVGSYRVDMEWDSTGRQLVTNGNGHSINHQWVASSQDKAKQTLLTEEGDYLNGFQHGVWKGQTADGSYQYEERYEQGQCLGGKTTINGQTTTYSEALKSPEFEGGQKEMYAFLAQNITYPVDAQRAGIMGKVFVSFTVCTDGSLCDFKLLRGVHKSLDREALRVVKRMNKLWKPGSQRGKPIRVKYSLPIAFQLG
ncbi:energy transducer TonB [Fibrella aestuarina]|nr:energy transducer TonB [Fibrella aestuarina]